MPDDLSLARFYNLSLKELETYMINSCFALHYNLLTYSM